MRVVCALLLACGALPAAQDAPVELAFRLKRGTAWTVKQTAQLQSDNTDAAGQSVGPGSANAEISLTEEWTDRATRDRSGKVQELGRSWQKATATVTHGETWTGPVAITDCGLKLTAGRKATTVAATKGTPEGRTLDMLRRAPPDAAMALLPTKRVKPGDTWTVRAADAIGYVDALLATLPQVKPEGSLAMNVSMLLGKCQPGTTTVAPMPELTVTFASLTDGRATLQARGELAIPKQGTPPRGGGTCVVTATLTVDVEAGTPVQLVTKIVRTEAPGPGSGFARAGPNGIEEMGLTETWTVTRSWTRVE